MTVKHSLLAILTQSPCYGYQLRAEFERRTSGLWPLNVGQIYNTLDRLERDGYVTRDDADEQGHVMWQVTPAGTALAEQWLTTHSTRDDVRDELAMKIALATSLPHVDAGTIISAELDAARDRAAHLDALVAAEADPAARVLRSAAAHRAAADVTWLTAAREDWFRGAFSPTDVRSERPRRGRPRSAA